MALLNEAAHGHFNGLREAINALDDDLRGEAARLSATGLSDQAGHDPATQQQEALMQANLILKAFHQRHIQARMRILDARIAATPADDVEQVNALQREKISLRKANATPPTLAF